MNPQQIFSWELGAAGCSGYFLALLAVVVSGVWWVWSVFSFLSSVRKGSRRTLSLSLGTLMILSLREHQYFLYLTPQKVPVVPAGAAGCYQGLRGEEKRKSFGLPFPKLFFSDLNNTASSRLFSHFLKSWSFQCVFPELCRVISCSQHLKEKCGASETSLLFAVFTTN